jgi:hypothetical protein
MSRRLSLASMVGGILALTLTAPASAQVYIGGQVGTHNQRPAIIESEDQLSVRKAAQRFGICVAAKRQKLAEQAVEFPASRHGLSAALKNASTRDCLEAGGLKFNAALLRAVLFEGLYTLKFGRGPSRDLSRAGPVDFASWYPPPLTDHATTWLTFVQMGACAARANQVAAWKLVMSEPGTAGEREAIAELQPGLPGCLPKGLTYRASVDMLRGAFAEAMYRLSERAPVAAEVRQ